MASSNTPLPAVESGTLSKVRSARSSSQSSTLRMIAVLSPVMPRRLARTALSITRLSLRLNAFALRTSMRLSCTCWCGAAGRAW